MNQPDVCGHILETEIVEISRTASLCREWPRSQSGQQLSARSEPVACLRRSSLPDQVRRGSRSSGQSNQVTLRVQTLKGSRIVPLRADILSDAIHQDDLHYDALHYDALHYRSECTAKLQFLARAGWSLVSLLQHFLWPQLGHSAAIPRQYFATDVRLRILTRVAGQSKPAYMQPIRCPKEL